MDGQFWAHILSSCAKSPCNFCCNPPLFTLRGDMLGLVSMSRWRACDKGELKVTVITFTRERCEWDSGLEAATLATRMLTRTLAGLQCPGSSLKRCIKLSSEHVTRDPLDF